MLLHAIVSFASGRLRSPTERLVVTAGYLTSVTTIARTEVVPLAVWALSVMVLVRRTRTASADRRWETTAALRSSLAVTLVLAGASLARTVAGRGVDPTVLLAYQLVLASVAVGLTRALVRDRSVQVADLGRRARRGDERRAPGRAGHSGRRPKHRGGLPTAWHGRVRDGGREPVRSPHGGR